MLPFTRKVSFSLGQNIGRGIRFQSTAAYETVIKSVRQDLKNNIKAKADVLERNVIKSILVEVKNFEVNNPGKTKDEFQLHDLLTKLANQRRKTAQEYLKDGTSKRSKEMGEKELSEIPYIEKYLKELPVASEAEIEAKVEEIANELIKEGPLDNPKKLFGKIPWNLIQSEWKASRSSVTSVIPKVLEKYK
ncbi:hypothetical protein OGAPHI_003424 [Ogataea philodendri]|uniref:Altered inheritance of mitochondria protein 41 n=1 Tax=Ogataea philodendri TaxID=1378263 RepID=A0A9P8P963_9ASCO|nr:uncharacterized protein OGAPHI_003424 [Ogataea philodendri]KAH3666974.1 hypothetical protein OGAPHI_003424 [Ogataea philodendri]